MGRGVSYANGSVIIKYRHIDMEDEYEYEDLKANLSCDLMAKYKSLSECEKWLGNEDLAILENDLVYIGLSEYCGVVSLWVVPKENLNNQELNLALSWCRKVEKNIFKDYATLSRVGGFSDGTSVYTKVVTQ